MSLKESLKKGVESRGKEKKEKKEEKEQEEKEVLIDADADDLQDLCRGRLHLDEIPI
jgi:hypothetical protein